MVLYFSSVCFFAAFRTSATKARECSHKAGDESLRKIAKGPAKPRGSSRERSCEKSPIATRPDTRVPKPTPRLKACRRSPKLAKACHNSPKMLPKLAKACQSLSQRAKAYESLGTLVNSCESVLKLSRELGNAFNRLQNPGRSLLKRLPNAWESLPRAVPAKVCQSRW